MSKTSLIADDLCSLAPDALRDWFAQIARLYELTRQKKDSEQARIRLGNIYSRFVQAGVLVNLWPEQRAKEFLEKKGAMIIAGHVHKRIGYFMSAQHQNQVDQNIAQEYLLNSLQSMFKPAESSLIAWRSGSNLTLDKAASRGKNTEETQRLTHIESVVSRLKSKKKTDRINSGKTNQSGTNQKETAAAAAASAPLTNTEPGFEKRSQGRTEIVTRVFGNFPEEGFCGEEDPFTQDKTWFGNIAKNR